MTNELINNPHTDIKKLIYEIRGQQVMLDSDLAMLYGYKVKRFNEQVKNNLNRFPHDFRFQLTEDEYKNLRSKFSTSSSYGGRRYLPYVFTEQGIYMLAAVLKGDIAIKQSVMIMRTFKDMRHYLIENQGKIISNIDIQHLLDTSLKHEQDISKIKELMTTKISRADFNYLNQKIETLADNFIKNDNLKEYVFLNGQQFEADEAYIEIYQQAKESIIVIDDYISAKTLSHLKNKRSGVNVTIYTDNKGYGSGKLRKTEYNDFNHEYPPLRLIVNNNNVHDRFIILDYNTDNEKAYHCGASSKDAGNKICSIMQYRDSSIVHPAILKPIDNEEYKF